MSNYKPRIESNNLDLTSILAIINELPEAGPSGPTLETCTVTISIGKSLLHLYYSAVNDDGEVVIKDLIEEKGSAFTGTTTITTVTNALIYASGFQVGINLVGFYPLLSIGWTGTQYAVGYPNSSTPSINVTAAGGSD